MMHLCLKIKQRLSTTRERSFNLVLATMWLIYIQGTLSKRERPVLKCAGHYSYRGYHASKTARGGD